MELFKTAVILAGGKSSRMGFDKQFLKINEKKLMDTLIEALTEEFREIILVTNKPEEYAKASYKIVSDEIKEMGPLGGLHIGLKESSSKYVYFLACDMPNINLAYIRFMKEQIKHIGIDACVTKRGDKIEPFHGFYSKDLVQVIEQQLRENKRSLFSLVSRVNTLYIEENTAREYSRDLSIFLNLNTTADLEQYIGGIK
ncbi:MAG: molybdenum cofactor guanylyltransferase [Bacillota bacterium]|nr:molybdenum cofactor guanylyltransferase [Bacillota bacterium]